MPIRLPPRSLPCLCPGVFHLNEALCINELSRGSDLGYDILSNN
jgi:hypothetical protein